MTAVSIKKWRRYSEYRPSGVEWLGEVPEHWDAIPAKRRYGIQLGKMLQNNPESDSDVAVPYAKALHVLWGKVDTSDLPEMWASQTDLKQFGVKSGDLLVCEGGEAGRAGIVDSAPNPCIIQNALHRVRGKDADVCFLQYVLQTVGSGGWFDALCNKATIAHFTREKLAELRMPMPPSFDEQRAISAFLDHETERIDALIAKKERQIELLQEKRTALISHAVTKGLNPDAKMKSSGIEWLGEVPEHWKIRKAKYCCDLNMGQSPTSEECNVDGEGLPFLQGCAEFGAISPNPRQYCDTARKVATKGDILISVRAPVGALNIADQNYGIGRGLCSVRPRPDSIDAIFCWYLIHEIRNRLSFHATGSTYEAVAAEDVGNLQFVLPSLDEQRAIAAFLDRETARIDVLIEKIQESIKKLREFRTALISVAVTGKIDVRREVK